MPDPARATARTTAHEPAAVAALRSAALVGSIVLLVLGAGVTALGLLPSDIPRFFVRHGAVPAVAGATGLLTLALRRGGPLAVVARAVALVAGAATAVDVGALVITGRVLGFAAWAAPVLLGLPAAINVAAAVRGVHRRPVPGTCRRCGYDLRGELDGPSPECGLAAPAA